MEKEAQWYFSIVDVVEVLTGSSIPKRYWSDLKKKLVSEGSEVYENIVQLKFEAADGKNYATDCLDTQNLLRLIQSIPSPKAEPFKQWLAKVGYERMQQRMTGQETRNKLTDYWKESGVEKGDEFAFLTNVIHQEWTGLTVKSHKDLKDLKSQNLRDHMSEAELIFTALAELSTRQIAEAEEAKGVIENARAGKKGEKGIRSKNR